MGTAPCSVTGYGRSVVGVSESAPLEGNLSLGGRASSSDSPDGSKEPVVSGVRRAGAAVPTDVVDAVRSPVLSVVSSEDKDAAIEPWSPAAAAPTVGKMKESNDWVARGDRMDRLESCIVLSRIVC